MNSNRGRALKEKNVVATAVKSLNRKMEDFMTAVEDLKILSETATELHDNIVQHATINSQKMKKLDEDLVEHRKRALNEAAMSDGKVVISQEEYDELVTKYKAIIMGN